MELNHDIIDTPPRDAASVVMLRDAPDGLQVLLLRRHADSAVLGGAYVFPGGKVDAADAGADTLARLDRPPAELHARLGEPALSANQAAALYVAAAREAAEESGVLFLQVAPKKQPPTAPTPAPACAPAGNLPRCWPSMAPGLTPTPSPPGRAGSRRAARR